MDNKDYSSRLDIRRAVKKTENLLYNYNGSFTNAKSVGDYDFYPFYAVTNENLGYFADLDIAGKDTLTVTGSGDHAFNLAFFGAKSVETFDINHLTFLAFDLKKNALLHLTRKEFIAFYSAPLFKKSLYSKVSPYLRPQTRAVFDIIVSTERAFESCVAESYDCSNNIVKNNPYMMSEATYKEMQNRLKNLKSPIVNRHCPVNKLSRLFGPKDVVILSNILHYSLNNSYDSADFNLGSRENSINFLRSLNGVLNDSGVVSLLYMYNKSNDERKLREALNINTRTLEVRDNLRGSHARTHRVLVADKEDFPELE